MKTPNELGLPFDAWRPGQQLAIRTALSAKTPVVVIQSPTGSGKSTIATGILALDDKRGFILTATNGLLEQYGNTFDSLTEIRGMGNYRCIAAKTEFERLFKNVRGQVTCDNGPCRSGMHCSLKENGCTYFDAVRDVMAAQTGITNYAYWLAMRRYGRGLGHVNRLICDEAHALAEELMAINQVNLPLALVTDGRTRLPRTAKRWREWAAARIDEHTPKGDLPHDAKAKKQRIVDALTRLSVIDETWAWDIRPNSIIFEPTVPRLLMKSLADRATARSLVLLSATITPATLSLLGIPASDVTFMAMKSRFDARRRPVYVVDTVRVDHKMKDIHFDYWISRMDAIIRNRLDRKGIIHSVSYDRAKLILKRSKHSGIMVAPAGAHELAVAVERFRRMKPPAILLSPSVTTGWDFPYTDCEYQIVAKLPFPDTRSSIMRARIAATEHYREHLTMQVIEQEVGRGMRAEDDQCETFIIDNHARWFIPAAAKIGLVSDALLDAIHYVKGVPAPPSPLA
jgi:ATP-dependent DNA helicase DinG